MLHDVVVIACWTSIEMAGGSNPEHPKHVSGDMMTRRAADDVKRSRQDNRKTRTEG